jgi:hypothetical protein
VFREEDLVASGGIVARSDFEVQGPNVARSLSVRDGSGELDTVVKGEAVIRLLGCVIFEVVRGVFGLEETAVLVFFGRNGHGLVGEFAKADRPLGVEMIVESF